MMRTLTFTNFYEKKLNVWRRAGWRLYPATKKKKLKEEQNAATLGVSLVVLGPPWGPLWPWVCDMPILDLDEVGKTKKTFSIGICK